MKKTGENFVSDSSQYHILRIHIVAISISTLPLEKASNSVAPKAEQLEVEGLQSEWGMTVPSLL